MEHKENPIINPLNQRSLATGFQNGIFRLKFSKKSIPESKKTLLRTIPKENYRLRETATRESFDFGVKPISFPAPASHMTI